MKYLLLPLVLCFSGLFGQSIKLKADNPAPRVGQPVSITPYLFNESEPLNSATSSLLEHLDIGGYSFQPVDTGTVYFGPINVKLDHREIWSDSIRIQVLPQLPDKIGFWIRKVDSEGDELLVLEQKIPAIWIESKEPEKKRTKNWPFDRGPEIGSLNLDAFDQSEIKIDFRTSKSIYISIEEDGQTHICKYRIFIYEMRKGSAFNGEYIVTRKHFHDLPKEVNFDQWIIK